MKLLIDIPDYKLDEVQNGSIASNEILKAVRNGIPYEERPQGEWAKGFHEGFKNGSMLAEAFNERPKGKWIVVNQDNEGIHEIKCPFCQYSKGSDFSSILTVTFERLPPFCEKCGSELGGDINDASIGTT